MTRTPLLVTLAVSFTLSACDPAVSIRPLYSADECRVDARVEGEWISPDEEGSIKGPPPDDSWTITRRSNRYDVEVRTDRDDEGEYHGVTRYDVCLVSLDAGLFFDAEFVEAGEAGVRRGSLPTGTIPAHVVGRVLLEQDFIVLRFVDSSWVEHNTPEAFRQMTRVGHDDIAVITGLQSELRQFVSEHANNPDAFGLTRYLCRPEADCQALIYDFYLRELAPEMPQAAVRELLEGAAEYHLEAGHYERSVDILRRRVVLPPDDATVRNMLGTALLLAGDVEEARHEFRRAQHIRPGDFAAREGLAWSYVLEGQFAQAGDAFQALAESPARTSVEPALLAYVALARAGETERAAAVLSRELQTFSGTADDHLLLLFAAHRLDGADEVVKGAEDTARAHFFLAELLLAEGSADAARRHLWECLTRAGRERLYSAVARRELEGMSTARGGGP